MARVRYFKVPRNCHLFLFTINRDIATSLVCVAAAIAVCEKLITFWLPHH